MSSAALLINEMWCHLHKKPIHLAVEKDWQHLNYSMKDKGISIERPTKNFCLIGRRPTERHVGQTSIKRREQFAQVTVLS